MFVASRAIRVRAQNRPSFPGRLRLIDDPIEDSYVMFVWPTFRIVIRAQGNGESDNRKLSIECQYWTSASGLFFRRFENFLMKHAVENSSSTHSHEEIPMICTQLPVAKSLSK